MSEWREVRIRVTKETGGVNAYGIRHRCVTLLFYAITSKI